MEGGLGGQSRRGCSAACACTAAALPCVRTHPPPFPPCSDCKSDENWTCITFYPDLERFGMEGGWGTEWCTGALFSS